MYLQESLQVGAVGDLQEGGGHRALQTHAHVLAPFCVACCCAVYMYFECIAFSSFFMFSCIVFLSLFLLLVFLCLRVKLMVCSSVCYVRYPSSFIVCSYFGLFYVLCLGYYCGHRAPQTDAHVLAPGNYYHYVLLVYYIYFYFLFYFFYFFFVFLFFYFSFFSFFY